MNERHSPNKKIGEFLKQRRESIHESLAEVCGAVEIDLEMLHKIETGQILPSEDILLLLISHLNIEEKDAMRLIDIAGYDQTQPLNEEAIRQMFMVIPFDNRIMYAEDIQVKLDKKGVVIEFLQANINGQKTAVSRIGMSKEQANEMLKMVTSTMDQPGGLPRQLPAGRGRKRKQR